MPTNGPKPRIRNGGNALIPGALGKQRFFVKMVDDGAWDKTNDDILLIQDEGTGPDYKGENSNDFRDPVPHFFICKYQLVNEEIDSVFKPLLRGN